MVSRAPGLYNVGIKGRGNAMVSPICTFITIDHPNICHVHLYFQEWHYVEMTLEIWVGFCAAPQTPFETCSLPALLHSPWTVAV